MVQPYDPTEDVEDIETVELAKRLGLFAAVGTTGSLLFDDA